MMPQSITSTAFDEALMLLGIEDPTSIVHLKFDGDALRVIRLVRDGFGEVLSRGNNPVYEETTYELTE